MRIRLHCKSVTVCSWNFRIEMLMKFIKNWNVINWFACVCTKINSSNSVVCIRAKFAQQTRKKQFEAKVTREAHQIYLIESLSVVKKRKMSNVTNPVDANVLQSTKNSLADSIFWSVHSRYTIDSCCSTSFSLKFALISSTILRSAAPSAAVWPSVPSAKNNSINGSAETKCVILTFIQHRLQNNLRLLNLQHAITCTGLQKRTMCICVIAFRHFFRFFLLWIANKNHQSIQTVWYWMRNVYEMSTTK